MAGQVKTTLSAKGSTARSVAKALHSTSLRSSRRSVPDIHRCGMFQLAEWIKEAIEKNQRKPITDGDDLTVKSETGLLISPGGGPVRTTGILVNCPVVGFTKQGFR